MALCSVTNSSTILLLQKGKHGALYRLESRAQSSFEQPGNETERHWCQFGALGRERVTAVLLTVTPPLVAFSSPLACDQSCKTCGPSSPRCLTCTEKTVLYDGKCISECPDGYYADATGRCKGRRWDITTIIITASFSVLNAYLPAFDATCSSLVMDIYRERVTLKGQLSHNRNYVSGMGEGSMGTRDMSGFHRMG